MVVAVVDVVAVAAAVVVQVVVGVGGVVVVVGVLVVGVVVVLAVCCFAQCLQRGSIIQPLRTNNSLKQPGGMGHFSCMNPTYCCSTVLFFFKSLRPFHKYVYIC